MGLYARTRMLQSPKSRTQYITIPSIVVADSQYPFTANEEVELYVDEDHNNNQGIGGKRK